MRTCAFRDLSPAFHLCNVRSLRSPDMNLDKLKLILVPTDFSEPSAIALRAAVRLAQAFGASIEVLHVDINPSLVLPPPIDLVSLPLVFERVAAGTTERLERIVGEVRQAGVVCSDRRARAPEQRGSDRHRKSRATWAQPPVARQRRREGGRARSVRRSRGARLSRRLNGGLGSSGASRKVSRVPFR
jgi:hypothetical protein